MSSPIFFIEDVDIDFGETADQSIVSQSTSHDHSDPSLPEDEATSSIETELTHFRITDSTTEFISNRLRRESEEAGPEFFIQRSTILEALMSSQLLYCSTHSPDFVELMHLTAESAVMSPYPPSLNFIHDADVARTDQASVGVESSVAASPLYLCVRYRRRPEKGGLLTLFTCSNCNSVRYCSRSCQEEDWIAHQNLYCVNPGVIPTKILGKPNDKGLLKSYIRKPFGRLGSGTWLRGRCEEDVYRLLIDSFRLRERDDFEFAGITSQYSIYNGSGNSYPVFRQYLDQAEVKELLPRWWSPEKRCQCLDMALDHRGRNFHDIFTNVTDVEIMVVYQDVSVVLQMRLFAESVYGRGPAMTDGKLLQHNLKVAERESREAMGL